MGKYGWVPDVPDQRDFAYKSVYGVKRKLPVSVDLRPICSKVEDQGNLGSCTANALVGAVEVLTNKDKKPFHDMSRLFVYYNERVIENSVGQDAGAMIRDGIKTLNKQGVCTEAIWPYIIPQFTKKPNVKCYAEALNYQIIEYARLSTMADMLSCLAAGFPFVFGFTVYESFESSTVAKTGVVPMPKLFERVLGGHAVLAVGYNAKGQFIVRNSWGVGWGDKGYFYMPFAYLTNRNLSDDLWVVKTGEQM